jgi:hypothetical protein
VNGQHAGNSAGTNRQSSGSIRSGGKTSWAEPAGANQIITEKGWQIASLFHTTLFIISVLTGSFYRTSTLRTIELPPSSSMLTSRVPAVTPETGICTLPARSV